MKTLLLALPLLASVASQIVLADDDVKEIRGANFEILDPVEHQYSKISKKGEVLPDDAIEWHCVRDLGLGAGINGLMWEVKQLTGPHHKDYKFTYHQSLDVWNEESYIHTTNAEKLCGYDDWRGPTKKELKGLVEIGQMPAINLKFFPNTAKGGYWTGEEYEHNDSFVWNIHFDEVAEYSSHKDFEYYVMLVRDVQPSDEFPEASAKTLKNQVSITEAPKSEHLAKARFMKIDAKGKALPDKATAWDCVEDSTTGLVWEVKQNAGVRSFKQTYDWNKAFNAQDATSLQAMVNKVGLCGFKDWRGPTRDELASLVDDTQKPVINPAFFPNTMAAGYWTALTFPEDKTRAWNVYFDYGFAGDDRKSNQHHVRLVRSGKAKP